VTVPLSVACAWVEVCAEDDGGLCAESAAAARTMSHNRPAGKTFILFECGREGCVESSSWGAITFASTWSFYPEAGV